MMKSIAVILCFAILLGACGPGADPTVYENRFDILIRGGQIFRGRAGDTLTRNDLGINDDKITFIGDASAANASGLTELSADGMIVTAGFIDPHTHSMDELLSDDKNGNLNYLFQGVTTVFTGNDGDGADR